MKYLILIVVLFFSMHCCYASFSGTYTVDPSKPASSTNYKDLKSAIYDICKGKRNDGGTANGQGVTGPVVFKIADGTYKDTFVISDIIAASAINTVTFTSASGDSSKVVLRNLNATTSLSITGAYIIIKNITIRADKQIAVVTGTSGHDITISNCRVLGDTSYHYDGVDIYNTASINFRNNVVRFGYYGILTLTNANKYTNSKNYIYGNVIDTSYIFGILADGDSVKFIKNTIRNSTTSAFWAHGSALEIDSNIITSINGSRGMEFTFGHNIKLRNNHITTTACTYGIEFFAHNVVFEKNFVYTNGCDIGIVFSGGSGGGIATANIARIQNNMVISIFKSSASGAKSTAIDISNDTVNFSNNSVYATTAKGYSTFGNVISVNSNTVSVNIQNNVLRAGPSIYLMQLIGLLNGMPKLSYNDLYSDNSYYAANTSGSKLTSYYKLSDWQKTGYDSNSISIDPQFISSTDLHVHNALLRQGIPISDITTDIDGDPRSSTHPFIGADEFKVYQNDASLMMADSMNYTFCPATPMQLIFRVKNTGYDTLRSAKLSWSANGKTQKDTIWKGKLALYGTADIVLPYYTDSFSMLKAWISIPNGLTDSTLSDDTVSFTVKHAITPAAGMKVAIECPGAGTSFTDNSTDRGGVALSGYFWDFGDGASATTKNANHIYTHSGYYVVTHAVKAYCVDTVRDTIYIPRLIAKFKSSSYCLGDTTYFRDSSISDGVRIFTYQFLFGDGTKTLNPIPKHVYAKTGTYKVTLKIFSALGCTDTISQFITIYSKPKARFGINNNNVCQGESLAINDSSTGSGLRYYWNFGDGNTDSVKNPVHVYQAAGTYHIKLLLSSTGSCTDTISHFVKVLARPKAYFTTSDVCVGDTMHFQDSSSIAGAATYLWDFGDSTASTSNRPSHVYKHAGTYKIREAVATNGCVDIYTKTVTVYAKPDAAFYATAHNQHVKFTPKDTTLASYSWTLGDSTTSTQVSPDHTYSRSGCYKVQLTTTNNNGCSSSDTASYDIIYTAVDEESINYLALNIYPNPFQDETIVSFSLNEKSVVGIALYDIVGRKMPVKPASVMSPGNHIVTISSQELGISPGIYNLELTIDGNKTTRTVVKVR